MKYQYRRMTMAYTIPSPCDLELFSPPLPVLYSSTPNIPLPVLTSCRVLTKLA